ncbi:MAG: EthD family reductase [Paracoccaceae bacterium]|nr:EthD family reductase [Paracoccaceae bacterium]MDE3121480.1 EthD family reductase [Paracoccaceae bacterium]MDE3240707.1 EthD family reductase [Paracoccaceae bacterium]
MARLVAMYKHPKDTAAFDAYYMSKHLPLAKTIPGLKGYDISTGPVLTPEGQSPYHLIATLHFDSLADIAAAFQSPEGQAAAADTHVFATGGVELYMFDTKDV